MPGTDNVDALFDAIVAAANTFNFRTTVAGKSLGLDCAGIAADGMLSRSVDDQKSADGTPFEPLDPKYLAAKIKLYGVALIGVRTFQMFSLESFLGGLRISDEEVQILYGTAQAPTESKTRHFDPETDGMITDIEKAFFFSGRRPFFELSEDDVNRVFDRIEQAVAEHEW